MWLAEIKDSCELIPTLIPRLDKGLKPLSACLKFGIFNGPKKNSNSTHFIQGFGSDKTITLDSWWSGSLTEQFKFESKFNLSPCLSSGNQYWFLKIWAAKSMTELLEQLSYTALAGGAGKYKHREHKHWAFPSQQQSLQAATGLPQVAKGKSATTQVHSCNTDLVRESKRFEWRVTDNRFFWHVKNEIFHGLCKNLLITKAALITLLDLLIIHWSLSKNKA